MFKALVRSPSAFAQCALVLVGLTASAFWPPASGRLLVVPIIDWQNGAAVRLAIRHGASLVDAGPVRGSIIVEGERKALGAAALAAGMLLLAAPRSGCGPAAKGSAT